MKSHERIVLVWVVALFSVALLFLISPLLPLDKWKADATLAAWVQAVGSIVAIAIAIAVPAWQHHADSLDQRNENKRKLLGQYRLLHTVTSDARRMLDALRQAILQERAFGGGRMFPDREISALRDRIAGVDLTMIDDASAKHLADINHLLSNVESVYRVLGGRIATLDLSPLESAIAEASQIVDSTKPDNRNTEGHDA